MVCVTVRRWQQLGGPLLVAALMVMGLFFLLNLNPPAAAQAGPAAAPGVTARAAPCRAVSLSWVHDPAYSSYEVWRGYSPYFTPATAGSEQAATLPPPAQGITMTYEEWYVTGTPFTHTFYVVRALTPTGAVDAGPVGEFEYPLGDSSPPVEEHLFCISIPQTIADGDPRAGAGNIEEPGGSDSYRFLAQAGDSLFVDFQGHSGLTVVDFTLTDPHGNTLADRCLGCGDPGTIDLPVDGPYLIHVGDPGAAVTGTYQIDLTWVPAPDVFQIAVGDTVSDGVPGPGAGNIEVPGAHDLYTFTATAGQQVFIDHQAYTGGAGNAQLQLRDAGGALLVDRCLACGDPGSVPLDLGGTYTISVGKRNHAGTGTYRFRLTEVPPPDAFQIAVGDTISDGVPGPGAGNVEVPGASDVYTFTAAAGQQVFVDHQGFTGNVSGVDLSIYDSSGARVASRCLGCGETATVPLELGGTYTIAVGDSRDDGTGTYRFRLTEVPPPDSFQIAVGDTVSDGVPGPGAGNVELPGAHDLYTFTASAGQQVLFDVQGYSSGMGGLQFQLYNAGGSRLFDRCLGCGDPGIVTLSLGGTYTATVGDPRDDATGTYQIEFAIP